MEETKKNEVMEVENEVEFEDYDEAETSEGSGKLLVAGAIVAGAVALGAIAKHKCKGKLRDWRIKQLEKAGYQVIEPEVIEADEEVSNEDETEE